MNIIKLISFFALLPAVCFSMNIENSDSVLAVIQSMPDDTNKVKAINDFAFKTLRKKTDRSLELCKQALVLSKDLTFVKGEIKANNIIGLTYLLSGQSADAELYMLKALNLSNSIGDRAYAGKVLNNLGALAVRTNDYAKAIEYNLQALTICEENNDSLGMAKCYANIGINHKEAKNYNISMKYLNLGVAISDSINDLQNLSICLNALGSLNKRLNKADLSTKHFKEAIAIYLQLPDYYGLAIAYGSIARNFESKNEYDSAMIYVAKSNKYAHKMNYKNQIVVNYGLMADLYKKNNKLNTAQKFANQAFEIACNIKDKKQIQNSVEQLASIHSALKNYEKAYNYLELSKAYSDSILTSEKQELIIELDTKYNSERKQREIELLQKDKLLQDQQLESQAHLIRNQRLQFYLILMALLSVLAIAYVYYKNYKIKKQSNDQLKLQRNTIAKQNKKITDSIVYAQHIQAAILPNTSLISNILPESFLLFIPRDIVSGDFFWIKESDNKIILAVVDCTGHGVPGAFMSILGTQLLNEITDFDQAPEIILDGLREKLKIAMKQSDYLTSQRDGMDVGLCCIDTKSQVLKYAGANINLIHFNNGEANLIKGNHQPVAIYLKESEFIGHSIKYSNDDQFYMATDGYSDQYGGKNFEKYKSKRLYELLKKESNHNLTKQKQHIHTEFLTWKGEHEQIDDVTVFGFKCP